MRDTLTSGREIGRPRFDADRRAAGATTSTLTYLTRPATPASARKARARLVFPVTQAGDFAS
jgi:hypothetical protein